MANPLKIQEVYGLDLDEDYDDEDIRIHLCYINERKILRGDDEQSDSFTAVTSVH